MSDYETNRAKGSEFERFVSAELLRFGLYVGVYETKEEQYKIGESRMGLEIKFDDQLSKTGNVYIETAEKRRAHDRDWILSGVYRPDNSILYGVGDRREFFVFGKFMLRRVDEAFRRNLIVNWKRPPSYRRREIATSQGFTLARIDAAAWAEKYYRVGNDGHWDDARSLVVPFKKDDVDAAEKLPCPICGEGGCIAPNEDEIRWS